MNRNVARYQRKLRTYKRMVRGVKQQLAASDLLWADGRLDRKLERTRKAGLKVYHSALRAGIITHVQSSYSACRGGVFLMSTLRTKRTLSNRPRREVW